MYASCLLDSRALIRVTGSDAYNFLQGLITQDIHRLKTEPLLFTLLLSAKGRVVADVFCYGAQEDEAIALARAYRRV